MLKKVLNFSVLLLTTAVLWYINLTVPNLNTYKLFQTALALVSLYFIFKVVLEELLASRIDDSKHRYTARKTISIAYLSIFLIVFITIWIQNVQALFVAYGLVAAGVAISLQDFFKNIMGGVILLTSGVYRVGDRIEIEGKHGDIIDVGLLYTSILEIQDWIAGDQTTGRIIVIPNGFILSKAVNNYTKDNIIIWDEITIPITYDSDWKKALKKIDKIVQKETKNEQELAEKEIEKLSSRYYLSTREATPSIYLKLTDNWIELYVRYVTRVRERRDTYTKLSTLILEAIQKDKSINIASETLDITSFPGRKN